MTRYTLTPKQQTRLIEYALDHLFSSATGNGHHPAPQKRAGTRNWTAKQRAAAAKRMSALWVKKRQSEKKPAKKDAGAA